MPTPIYPSWNDKEYDLLKKMTENTALIADYEIGDVASVAGTANQVLVNGGTAAATGNITLSLPSLISGISRISTTGTTTGATDLLINPTTKASGNLIDAQVNGSSKFSVTSAGAGTFGGNLTVSGTGTSSFAGPVTAFDNTNGGAFYVLRDAGNNRGSFYFGRNNSGTIQITGSINGSSDATSVNNGILTFNATNGSGTLVEGIRLNGATNLTTIAGNLTVSGTTGITATDLILGSSGPSVKSTLSARAPRQGLVFDGTAGATVASVPAFGTGDFTLVAFGRLDSLPAASVLFGNLAGGLVPQTFVDNLGRVVFTGSTSITTSAIITAQKAFCLTIVRASGQTTIYNNGIVVSGPTADTRNNSNSIDVIGRNSGGNYVNGFLAPLIYNRALTAAEVVALYEAGAPSGADYNNASNTSLITGDNSTFASDTGWWSKNNSTIGSGVATLNAAGATIYRPSLLTVGKRYRVTWTVVSGQAYLSDGSTSLSPTRSAGTYTEEFIATSANYFGVIASGGAASVDNITLFPLGLLLAPDAAQSGGGLVWYDTSGNSANITLPASGVSWNVPTSGNVTSGTALNLRAGGTNQNITLTPSGTGEVYIAGGVMRINPSTYAYSTVGGDCALATYSAHALVFVSNSSERARINSGGNFLLGKFTDSANGKLQLADHTTSAGGIGFGADGHIFRQSATRWTFGGTNSAILFLQGSGSGFYFNSTGSAFATGITESSSGLVFTAGTALALTLDSSQKATFAGNVTINKASPDFTLTRSANTNSGLIQFTTSATYDFAIGLRNTTDSDLHFYNYGTSNDALKIERATSAVTLNSTTASTSTSSGALVVSGGVGVGGTVNAASVTTTGAFVSTRSDGGVTLQSIAASTSQKFIRLANTGGDVYFGTESSVGGGYFTGSAAYDSVIYSPANPVFVSTPNLKLTGNLTVSGTQNVFGLPTSANALGTNSTMTFELTSNTSLTIKVRGSDGTTRSVALTLA